MTVGSARLLAQNMKAIPVICAYFVVLVSMRFMNMLQVVHQISQLSESPSVFRLMICLNRNTRVEEKLFEEQRENPV